MKVLLYMLALLSAPLLSQVPSEEMREKIKPLRSTRSDVLKIAKRIAVHPAYERYETATDFIDVKYSEVRCIWHGWNVAPDTVLSFKIYPKKSILLKDIEGSFGADFIRTMDDDFTSHYSNSKRGIQFSVRQDGFVSNIRHVPSALDSAFRCRGFPAFNFAIENYSPIHRFEINNASTWDVGLLGGFFIKVRDDSRVRGTVFVYRRSTGAPKHRIVKARIEEYAYKLLKIPRNRLRIEDGGLRDAIEVEAFMVPNDYPPPLLPHVKNHMKGDSLPQVENHAR
jgi:hypothetical protein